MPDLSQVFGLSAEPRYAYIDRGKLDAKLRAILEAKVHGVIHGGSKQGKTWLRDHVLDSSASIAVQCQPNSTVASLFQEALGLLGVRSVLVYRQDQTLSGELDFSASAEFGTAVIAKARTEMGLKIGAERAKGADEAPVGRTPGDLAWVSLTLKESGKRVILEDFHYLPASVQRDFAFTLKGLHGYDVYFLMVGVWAQSDLLTFYNGDLDGRVDEVRLEWTDDELHDVLDQGARRLNVELSADVAAALVAASYRNVGLLHRLTEHSFSLADVEKRIIRRQEVSDIALVSAAQSAIAERMRGRYFGFSEAMTNRSQVHCDIMKVIVAATDEELTKGLELHELTKRLSAVSDQRIRRDRLLTKLTNIADTQRSFEITPPIIAWDIPGRRLFVVEQAFLFYRRHGSPVWPWEN